MARSAAACCWWQRLPCGSSTPRPLRSCSRPCDRRHHRPAGLDPPRRSGRRAAMTAAPTFGYRGPQARGARVPRTRIREMHHDQRATPQHRAGQHDPRCREPACRRTQPVTLVPSVAADAQDLLPQLPRRRLGQRRSTGHAWRTLAKAGNAALRPGDRLRLERGCSFTGPLRTGPNSSPWAGTASQPITIDAWGTGGRPRVQRRGRELHGHRPLPRVRRPLDQLAAHLLRPANARTPHAATSTAGGCIPGPTT